MKKFFAVLAVSVMVLALSAASFAADEPEVKVIKWGRGNSGNILVTIAKNFGYFKEYGIEIDDIPIDNEGVFTSLLGGHVDVLSDFGTKQPLRLIVAGNTGQYAVTEPLLNLGHDPMNEIEWIQIPEDSDKLSAEHRDENLAFYNENG